MKIFADPELKKELKILDLGIVQAGDSKDYTFYVHNDFVADLKELKFTNNNEEIKILSNPN